MAGGLGNQLFQLAAGLYVEQNTGREVKYSTSNLVKKTKSEIGNYTRSFELNQLIPKDKIVFKIIPSTFNALSFLLQKQLHPKSLLVENGPLDNILEKISEKTRFLYGYFQNSEVVEQVWPEMRELMKNSEKFRLMIGPEKYDRIAIHLRFGDYFEDSNTKSLYGLTTKSYYSTAISTLRNLDKNLNQLLIVTDNLLQAQKFFSDFRSDFKVDFSSHENSLVNLLEIAKSSSIITSNSTFSWWGAWFAYKEIGANVISPRPWLAELADPELPIYVNDWIQIKREFET